MRSALVVEGSRRGGLGGFFGRLGRGGSVVVNLEVSWGNEVQKMLWEKGFCAGF